MKRVLVTGAAGWIGRYTLPLLVARGYEVHAVSTKPPAPPDADIQWHQADLLDAAQTSTLVAAIRPTHLLHLAWCTAPGIYWASPENFRWVRASLALLESFAAHGGERVVTAGTCAEYDWDFGYCVESRTPLAPTTVYGLCKDALRALTDSFAATNNLSHAWGRLFFLYGPHEHRARLVPSVINALLHDEPARCTHGNQVRDYLFIADAAAAFVALLDSGVTGAVNIASGQPVTIKEIVTAIAETMNRNGLLRLGEIPTPANDPPLLVADVRRLQDEVRWSPHDDLRAGLGATIDWWQTGVSEERRIGAS